MKTKSILAWLITTVLLTACGGKGVYGKVRNGETGKPISGAAVALDCTDCDAHFVTTTDSDGNYSFPEPAAQNYVLSIVWSHPPDCPKITPFDTLSTSGDFLVTYAGYGGIGGMGNRRMIAVVEFQLEAGQSKKFNLELACP